MAPRIQAARDHAEAPSTADTILDVAERLFAEQGYDRVSVREITTEAGLKNQASLYSHFRDKRTLYEAVLSRGIEPLHEIIATEPADTHVDRLIDYLSERPDIPRLIQRAGLEEDPELRTTIRRLLRPLYDQGVQLLEKTGGPWSEADIAHLGLGLYHLIFGFFASARLLETVLDENPRHPDAVARQRRFLKTAIMRLVGMRLAHSSSPTRSKKKEDSP